jgi:uncharacterized protein YjbI with pentapeptide repeats
MSVGMKELEKYYKVLGLELGASLEEINQAYKDLAFIWHPDRIPKDNQRLLEKAIAKLQEINHAREKLRSLESNQKSSRQSKSKSSARSTTHATKIEHPHPTWEYPHSTYDRARRPYYEDYGNADLRGANLKEKDLSGRNMAGADLSEADLSDSFLHKVNLEAAILYKTNLFRANLLQANLRRANLQQAKLIGADFSGADLREADLRGAQVGFGNRIMVKLTGAILTGATLPDGRIHS